MMHWSDSNLVETLFHELAHQKLYVSGDTAFNESFATAVAEFGMERWRSKKNLQHDPGNGDRSSALLETVRQMVAQSRLELEDIYSSGDSDDEMRARKAETLNKLSEDAQAAIDASELEVENWLVPPLNNARLASSGVYESHLPAFRQLLVECDLALACFYDKSNDLADLNYDLRQERLAEIDRR